MTAGWDLKKKIRLMCLHLTDRTKPQSIAVPVRSMCKRRHKKAIAFTGARDWVVSWHKRDLGPLGLVHASKVKASEFGNLEVRILNALVSDEALMQLL